MPGVAPSAGALQALHDADDTIRLALERVLGQSVSTDAWGQAGLKTSMGGLGIKHSEDLAHAAFLGSVVDTAPLVLRLLARTSVDVPELGRVAHAYSVTIGPGIDAEVALAVGRLERDPVSEETSCLLSSHPQKTLQQPQDERTRQQLIHQSSANSRDRLEATGREHAGAWLSAFPCKNLGLWLQPAEFKVSVRLWLGLADRMERRALLKNGAAMYGRHHALRDVLFQAARSAGLRPRREVMVDSSGRRPADVYFPDWSRGEPLAVDVTVTNPSQTTTTLAARDGVTASELSAMDRDREKNRLYSAQCAAQGVAFMAAPVCCYGGWLPHACTFVTELAPAR